MEWQEKLRKDGDQNVEKGRMDLAREDPFDSGRDDYLHTSKHVISAEFSLYEDVILDACCQNIASGDEIKATTEEQRDVMSLNECHRGKVEMNTERTTYLWLGRKARQIKPDERCGQQKEW
ncbi:hypothetical protein Tco_0767606 [Tanacetum coccineum]